MSTHKLSDLECIIAAGIVLERAQREEEKGHHEVAATARALAQKLAALAKK